MARKKQIKGKQRSSQPADVDLGARIRSRRLEAGISQTALASQLGVTFQQVQKYEKGVNRVSVSRLKDIADVLGESLEYFNGPSDPATSQIMNLMSDAQTHKLVAAFSTIYDAGLRSRIVGLVSHISAQQPE